MRLDWRAIGAGAAIALMVAVPAALIGELLLGDDPPDEQSPLVFVFVALILLGCLAGGYTAGARRPDMPLTHGAMAALSAYVAVQAVGVVLVAARGDDIRVVAIIFNALLSASVGVLGGLLANRRAARPSP